MDELAELNPEALVADGFSEAYIGYASPQFNAPPLAAYDSAECVRILMERDGMDYAEALEFFELVQGYVNDKTNTETSLENYLAGSRSTRELLRRLKGMPPAEPLLDVIDVNDNDLPEELNEMLIQDIINFIKMINSHNLIFTASTDRQKLIEPKLFERIFCMFVDPDSFEIDGNMDGILKNKMIEAGLLNQEGTKLSETYRESGVPQFNQFYVEVV